MTALRAEATFGSATSSGASLTPVETTADDPITGTWRRNHPAVSRDRLLDAAKHRINTLLALPRGWDGYAGLAPTALAGMVANGILELLVFDGGPTPQLSPGPERGIEIEWLVGGLSLAVGVLSDGEVIVSVEDSGGVVRDEWSFPFWATDEFAISRAKQHLHKMSDAVEHRL